MMRLISCIRHCLFVMLLSFAAGTAAAALGEILTDDVAAGADASALMAEENLFETLRKGIALSFARCEGIELCVPAVNRDELERIVNTLDSRITTISQRHDETGEKDLEEVLIAYAGTRDAYSQFMVKLEEMAPEEGAGGEEDLFSDEELPGEGEEGNAAGGENTDVFKDFSEDEAGDEE
ncbi:MAG: hypothetical protein ACE5GZ_12915 [Gammaproteobacteria bacterium]